MPIVSIFLGIVIRMFHDDHPPPHFHIQYGEWQAIMEIKTGKVLHGMLPKRVLCLVREWRLKHVKDLTRAWNGAMKHEHISRIKPLEKE